MQRMDSKREPQLWALGTKTRQCRLTESPRGVLVEKVPVDRPGGGQGYAGLYFLLSAAVSIELSEKQPVFTEHLGALAPLGQSPRDFQALGGHWLGELPGQHSCAPSAQLRCLLSVPGTPAGSLHL